MQGTPERVAEQLEHIAARHGTDELAIVTLCHDFSARTKSYELVAEALDSLLRCDCGVVPACACVSAGPLTRRVRVGVAAVLGATLLRFVKPTVRKGGTTS